MPLLSATTLIQNSSKVNYVTTSVIAFVAGMVFLIRCVGDKTPLTLPTLKKLREFWFNYYERTMSLAT